MGAACAWYLVAPQQAAQPAWVLFRIFSAMAVSTILPFVGKWFPRPYYGRIFALLFSGFQAAQTMPTPSLPTMATHPLPTMPTPSLPTMPTPLPTTTPAHHPSPCHHTCAPALASSPVHVKCYCSALRLLVGPSSGATHPAQLTPGQPPLTWPPLIFLGLRLATWSALSGGGTSSRPGGCTGACPCSTASRGSPCSSSRARCGSKRRRRPRPVCRGAPRARRAWRSYSNSRRVLRRRSVCDAGFEPQTSRGSQAGLLLTRSGPCLGQGVAPHSCTLGTSAAARAPPYPSRRVSSSCLTLTLRAPQRAHTAMSKARPVVADRRGPSGGLAEASRRLGQPEA